MAKRMCHESQPEGPPAAVTIASWLRSWVRIPQPPNNRRIITGQLISDWTPSPVKVVKFQTTTQMEDLGMRL
ncbi:hypothetical protein C8R44DRAFT_767197, partial [Mycena epipterygia]